MLFSRLGSITLAASILCLSVTQAQPPAKTPKKPAIKTTPPVAPAPQSDDQKFAERAARLWCLQPVKRPDVPAGLTKSSNPIDAFIAEQYRDKGLQPAPAADRLTLLRRVTLDLTGLPPAPADQDAFLTDTSPQAWDRVVDRLLADPQHGVRWARHWLDVLRYADQDSGMPAASGIYLWRDWVIGALNRDLPYDDFVRAQIVGSRYKEHSTLTATGHRQKVPGPVEDQFALGFLARAALTQDNAEQDLALNSVETISTAFMGLTVGCAKCHDHKFDPIRQKDFYAMKAIFDPLVVKRVVMATPAEIFANGNELAAYRAKKAPLDDEIETLVAPYRTKLYDERVAMLPPDVQAAVRKPEKLRTVAEQKTFDDYYPILRIDASKIKEILPPPDLEKYSALLRQQTAVGAAPQLPSYWTVEEDSALLKQPSYILTTGDPMRPEKDHPVEPGFPFKPESADFREGRREGFVDWLTADNNPLFARVAVNRVWAWHFGEGLEKSTSDFGLLGGTPSNRKLLDYLASEFVEHHYSMKWLHRLIVTSDTYRLASRADASVVEANAKADARNTYLWHFRLQRLEAEPIWDGILSAAGELDTTVGGKSFQMLKPGETSNRRAVYMSRGYVPSTDVMANFLLSFDVDDGRTPCPIRTQTVTAPQALFTMNDDAIEKATAKFSTRVLEASSGDIRSAVDLAYRTTLGRAPTGGELDSALTYLQNDPARMKGLAWMLFNLDEFIYVR